MKAVWKGIQWMSAIVFLALVVGVVVLVASGVVTREKLDQVVKVLRAPAPSPTPSVEPSPPTALQELELQGRRARLKEREDELGRVVALAQTKAEEAQQDRIAAADELKRIQVEREAWDAQKSAEMQAIDTERLKELKKRLEKMDEQGLASTLAGMWQEESKRKAVVDLLVLLKTSQAAEVLGLLRLTPEKGGLGEKEYQELVDRLRKTNYRIAEIVSSGQ